LQTPSDYRQACRLIFNHWKSADALNIFQYNRVIFGRGSLAAYSFLQMRRNNQLLKLNKKTAGRKPGGS